MPKPAAEIYCYAPCCHAKMSMSPVGCSCSCQCLVLVCASLCAIVEASLAGLSTCPGGSICRIGETAGGKGLVYRVIGVLKRHRHYQILRFLQPAEKTNSNAHQGFACRCPGDATVFGIVTTAGTRKTVTI